MLALVTGASSGIGYEISKYLSQFGYDIIAVGQNIERLNFLKLECKTNVIIERVDLSNIENCINLCEKYENKDISILVNCAGIGAIGWFDQLSLNQELNLINVNIIATHILTKFFIDTMLKNNKGTILNVASSAAFAPGPLMATYYATKSYVFKLSTSISKELKKKKSKVNVSVLCPGPVKTEFNKRLNIDYSVKPTTPEYVAKYSIKKLLKGKKVIIPGFKNKLGVIASKVLPDVILEEYIYNMQSKKVK